MPAFTTFLALWLLMYADQTVTAAEFRFNERVIETVIGVGIAYLYGLLFAAIARRRTPG